MKIHITILAIILNCCWLHSASGQGTEEVMTLEQVFQLAVRHSVSLQITSKNSEIARQQLDMSKDRRLPEIGTGLSYGYISNADIWTPSFAEHLKSNIPHQFTAFSLAASETIYQGGLVDHTIERASLEEKVAQLSQEKNIQEIKLLVAGQFLDICRLINQRRVYMNNTKLAQKRLANILTMKKQGMVTENDVLRTRLTISDLTLAVKKVDNNLNILNRQLNILTGREDTARITPDTTLLKRQVMLNPLNYYQSSALANNHELKIAAADNLIAETNIRILKSERMPVISLFAGSNLQRPYLNSMPATDIFFNVWQAGISIRYNISSTYQAPKKIRYGVLRLEQSQQREVLAKQQLNVAVSSYYIKHNEALDELLTLRSDLLSANENYRIVEKKYYNQLSLLTDIIDASNTKIEAEVKVANAEINVAYTYYQLLKAIGSL